MSTPFRKTAFIAAISTLLVAFYAVGCGDNGGGDGNGDDDGDGDGGYSSLTVEGDVEGEFEGYATFSEASLDDGTFGLALTDNSDYHLNLRIESADETVPEPGTYDIGTGGGFSEDAFTAIYGDLQDGGMGDPSEYTAQEGGAGEIEISDSGQDFAEGTFEFDAEEDPFDDEADGQIQVEGEFEAVRVEGGESLR